jgi:hypothetical protein
MKEQKLVEEREKKLYWRSYINFSNQIRVREFSKSAVFDNYSEDLDVYFNYINTSINF